jgi:hypothetical protein
LENKYFEVEKIKARKGLQENRAGRMASRAEGFFLLDLLFLFVSRQKESHSGSG